MRESSRRARRLSRLRFELRIPVRVVVPADLHLLREAVDVTDLARTPGGTNLRRILGGHVKEAVAKPLGLGARQIAGEGERQL